MSELVEKARKEKTRMNRAAIAAVILVETILFLAVVLIVIKEFKGQLSNPYSAVALGLIILWVGVVIGYLAWAIYFYNINYGMTNHDWAEIRNKRELFPEKEIPAPTINPHGDETLGLPPGTVRGILAISLLIGGLSLLIASLGMDDTIGENQFLVDNFEFFKTAFLMMIAFYFGHKALKHLNYSGGRKVTGPPVAGGGSSMMTGPDNFSGTYASDVDSGEDNASDPHAVNALSANNTNALHTNTITKDPETTPSDPAKEGDFDDPNALG